jgi:hypothetical protein
MANTFLFFETNHLLCCRAAEMQGFFDERHGREEGRA